MKSFRIKPTTLSITMTIILLLLGGLIVGGFYFAQGWLSELAASKNSLSLIHI